MSTSCKYTFLLIHTDSLSTHVAVQNISQEPIWYEDDSQWFHFYLFFSCHIWCPPPPPPPRKLELSPWQQSDISANCKHNLSSRGAGMVHKPPNPPPANPSSMNPFGKWILTSAHWPSQMLWNCWWSLCKRHTDRIFMWRSGSTLLQRDETTFTDVNNPF